MVTTKRNPGSGLREDVREAIERAWPDGVVEMAFDSDESWFHDVHPKLASAIWRIKGAQLAHEREKEPGPVWFDHSDPEEDPPDDQEPSRSYHLFFVCPEGEAFTYETEIESIAEPDWDGDEEESELPMETVAGSGRTGWAVAVSLIAPFAVITLSDMEAFEDGSFSEPTIESQGLCYFWTEVVKVSRLILRPHHLAGVLLLGTAHGPVDISASRWAQGHGNHQKIHPPAGAHDSGSDGTGKCGGRWAQFRAHY